MFQFFKSFADVTAVFTKARMNFGRWEKVFLWWRLKQTTNYVVLFLCNCSASDRCDFVNNLAPKKNFAKKKKRMKKRIYSVFVDTSGFGIAEHDTAVYGFLSLLANCFSSWFSFWKSDRSHTWPPLISLEGFDGHRIFGQILFTLFFININSY